MTYTIHTGNIRDITPDLEPVDAVLCDPPYGLGDTVAGDEMQAMLASWLDGQGHDMRGGGFMGRGWDASVIDPPVWEAIRNVCKPGAFLASFGGTRTFDLQSLAQRLAGWEMRDSLQYIYGSGFPKSHDVSKAIDKAKGAGRKRVDSDSGGRMGGNNYESNDYGGSWHGPLSDEPITPEAERFDGYGTALAPAHEPIGLWRKPTDQTFAECALDEGGGCLNIDGCRTGAEGGTRYISGGDRSAVDYGDGLNSTSDKKVEGLGRWPTNLLLVHDTRCTDACVASCPVRQMDEDSGERPSGGDISESAPTLDGFSGDVYGDQKDRQPWDSYGDTGGASRFFPSFRYMAKAARSEREAGLFDRDPDTVSDGRDAPNDTAYQRDQTERLNTHPCVKPIMLCKWLATLLLPPPRETPRRILVPFSGSGSECIGAMLAGWDEVIGIERNAEYADIARDRLAWWAKHGEEAVEAHKAEQARREHNAETGQTDLVDMVKEEQ